MRAMVFVGFSVEKLYGSAWCFTLAGPPKPGIIFHQHLDAEMSFESTRKIGDMLYRTFDIDRSMFMLKKPKKPKK